MLVGSAVALIFTGVSRAFCSPKEELLRLRDAGASQGGSFLPPRKRAQRVVTSSKYFGSSWAAARGGRPTRVASAAERAPQMAPEARGKVPPEMRQVPEQEELQRRHGRQRRLRRSNEKRLAGSPRHAYGELAAPLAAHMGHEPK
jgi:hypothetical protein